MSIDHIGGRAGKYSALPLEQVVEGTGDIGASEEQGGIRVDDKGVAVQVPVEAMTARIQVPVEAMTARIHPVETRLVVPQGPAVGGNHTDHSDSTPG